MKILPRLLPLLCLSAAAQEFPDFTRWMKASEMAVGGLRKMERKAGPQAVRAAETLGGVYEEMIGFFRQRGAANAVKWSEEGKSAAAVMASAAYANDAEAADAAFKTIGGTCRSCHDALRERTDDGKYRFKHRGAPAAPAPKPAAPKR